MTEEEKSPRLKSIVILTGGFIDSLDRDVLGECLRSLFPQCEIEIRANLPVSGEETRDGGIRDQSVFLPDEVRMK